MDIIIYDPLKLKKKIDNCKTNYKFTFLDKYKEYISINEIYEYLLGLERHQYKNIWNFIVKKWIEMRKKLINDSQFKNSKYIEMNYRQIHFNIELEELEKLIGNFINDKMKLIFVINSIMLY